MIRIADCGLRIADCGLRIADCGLRIAERKLPTKYAIRNTLYISPFTLHVLLFSRKSLPAGIEDRLHSSPKTTAHQKWHDFGISQAMRIQLRKMSMLHRWGLPWRILLLLLPLSAQSSDVIYYISPGIRINFNFQHGIQSIGGKVSFGFYADQSFVNLTVAAQEPFLKKTHSREHRFVFMELQYGNFYAGAPVAFGGGVGLSFFKKINSLKPLPRVSFFAGSLAFFTYDFVMTPSGKVDETMGVELALPIPVRPNQFSWGN